MKNKYPIDYDINVTAMYDALTQAMNSSWWEWLYWIRLFFWSWPSLWINEARDDACAFHIYFPPHKPKFHSLLIKEEWI